MPAERPEPGQSLPDDPERLVLLVSRTTAELDVREAAAARLLTGADDAVLDRLIGIAWFVNNEAWLQELIIADLVGRGDAVTLDRCRAMVVNARFGGRARGRLAMHLLGQNTEADLTHVRRLALDVEVDVRVCELIVRRLLERREPEDMDVLLLVALLPDRYQLTRFVVAKLLAVAEHEAVRRLWPVLWSGSSPYDTRLAIGETLAYSGTAADHDELRRLIATAETSPALRLRIAEILSHRGDGLSRHVLRILACDDASGPEIRAAALTLLAVPREAADVDAVRRVAGDRAAPQDLREAAMRSLGTIGTTSELGVIRSIGRDPSTPVKLRRYAGEMLAQLGDQSGLLILRELSEAGPQVGPLSRVREIIGQ